MEKRLPALALSQASPTGPTEGRTPAPVQRVPNARDVHGPLIATTNAVPGPPLADRHLHSWGADRELRSIDSDALDAWIGHMKAKGLSGATINRYLAVISKTMRFVQARTGIMRPKIEREPESQGRIRWLSGAEERALLELLETWGKLEHAELVAALLDTGMRPSELFALKAQDVNLGTGAIHIWANKTDHPRTIYATPRVLEVLKRRVKVAAPGTPLFPYDTGWMRNAWDRAKVHLKLAHDDQFIPYVCRHTCASRMVQRGVPLPVVINWMGHKALQMTMRYAHLSPGNLMEAASALAQEAA